jgi:hypothetical protein
MLKFVLIKIIAPNIILFIIYLDYYHYLIKNIYYLVQLLYYIN